MEIKFKVGEFQSFIATRTFALGNTNINIQKDTDVEFDGSTVRYAGAEYALPQLRGAVKVRWLVPAEDYEEGNPEYGRPERANIKVRSATEDKSGEARTMQAPVTTETDERVVMSTADHASNTKAHNTGNSVVEPQDGVSVGRKFKTAAISKTSLTKETAGTSLRNADNVQIEPGKGRSEQDMLGDMSDEDRAIYLAKKESIKSRYVDTDLQKTRQIDVKISTEKVTEKEGMKITQEVGGGVEIADMGGTGGQGETSVLEAEGMTFRTTNGPKRNKPEPHPRSDEATESTVVAQTEDVRRKIAKALCPEFPDSYDFGASERKRMARLQADFDDRPDVIRAVFAAESDDFKVKLVEEFPAAFQG